MRCCRSSNGTSGSPVDRGLLLRIVPLVKERIRLLSEIVEMADFFFI